MRFRKWIWIPILLFIFLLAAVCLTWGGLLPGAPIFSNVEPKAKDNPSLTLKSFDRIHGTNYLMAEIVGTDTSKFIASSGGESSQVHNLVFLDSSTLSSHRLFDTNTAIILNTTEYPRPPNQSSYYPYYEDQQNDNTITQWLVYEIVKEDTNEDKRKDWKDLRVIAVSDATGNNYVELLSNVNELYGISMIEDGQLVVIYEESGIRKASTLDLVNRTMTATQNLTEIDPKTQ